MEIENMELRQLQYFQEVCRSGSFTRAAANLYVAQPVITNAIHKLEAELGVRLLNRNNKMIALTAEGQVFLERITFLLEYAGDVIQEMHDFDNPNRSSLRLGIPPQIGNYFFPHLFTTFSALYPGLNLVVTEESSSNIVALVEKGELEVGLVVLPESAPHINARFLFTQPIVVCVGKDHPLNGRTELDLIELKDEKFIMRRPESYQRNLIVFHCNKSGFSPNIIFSSSQIQTIKTMVANNIGIAFFMEMTVRDDASVTMIPLRDPVCVNIGLVWKKEKYISKAAHAFIKFTGTDLFPHPNT